MKKLIILMIAVLVIGGIGYTVIGQGNNPPFSKKFSLNSTVNLTCGDRQLMFNSPCWDRDISYGWDITDFGNVSRTHAWVNVSAWTTIGARDILLFDTTRVVYDKKENPHRVIYGIVMNNITGEYNKSTQFIRDKNPYRKPNATGRGGGKNR